MLTRRERFTGRLCRLGAALGAPGGKPLSEGDGSHLFGVVWDFGDVVVRCRWDHVRRTATASTVYYSGGVEAVAIYRGESIINALIGAADAVVALEVPHV